MGEKGEISPHNIKVENEIKNHIFSQARRKKTMQAEKSNDFFEIFYYFIKH